MSNTDIYKSMLKSFVQDNFSLFQNAKVYEKDTSNDVFKYIPPHSERDDPNFIENTELFNTLFDQFKDAFFVNSNIVFDLKGHLDIKPNQTLSDYLSTSESYIAQNFFDSLKFKISLDLFYTYMYLSGQSEEIKRLSLFTFGDEVIEFQSSCSCRKCGAYVSSIIDLKNSKVEILNHKTKPCPFPDKLPTRIKVNLQAPSKKLVFLNNPKEFLNIKRKDQYECSINSLLGAIKETEFYAEHNVGFFFVGNTGLHAFKKGNEILFANYDEESLTHQKKYADYTNYGYVCMDLWWYTVLDFDLYNKLCSANNVNPDDISHIVVDIEGTDVSISHSHKAHTNGYNYGVHSKITIK